jgi:hypothetical protein
MSIWYVNWDFHENCPFWGPNAENFSPWEWGESLLEGGL